MITLPLPPSLNNAFVNRPDGKGRWPSRGYSQWREEAGKSLTLQSWDMPGAPYSVTIRVNIDHRSDIDNRVKPVLDLLVKHGVLTGDQWVNELHVYRDRTVDGCTVEFGVLAVMLPRWYRPPALTRYTGREIIARVAKLHDLDPDDITGPSRLRRHCEARWQVMRELAAKGLSTPRIGRLLNRDHSTVVHGLRRAG